MTTLRIPHNDPERQSPAAENTPAAPARSPVDWMDLTRTGGPFDPGQVRRGDRIGLFTVISDPIVVTEHGRCGVLSGHGAFPINRESALRAGYRESDFDHTIVTRHYADVRCDCGWVNLRLRLTGFAKSGSENAQTVACGHHRGMPPDHWYAHSWWRNRNAYREAAA